MFLNIHWFTIQVLFRLRNIIISGGSNNQRHLLSTTDWFLSIVLNNMGYKFSDIYDSFNFIPRLTLEDEKEYYKGIIKTDLNCMKYFLMKNILNFKNELILNSDSKKFKGIDKENLLSESIQAIDNLKLSSLNSIIIRDMFLKVSNSVIQGTSDKIIRDVIKIISNKYLLDKYNLGNMPNFGYGGKHLHSLNRSKKNYSTLSTVRYYRTYSSEGISQVSKF